MYIRVRFLAVHIWFFPYTCLSSLKSLHLKAQFREASTTQSLNLLLTFQFQSSSNMSFTFQVQKINQSFDQIAAW